VRQIVLDTEVSGLNSKAGDRLIEIAAVELLNGQISDRFFHTYVNPQRPVDISASRVHGLTAEDLTNKPTFGEVANAFLSFIKDSELLIHNADFDIAFIDAELARIGKGRLSDWCSKVTDTLGMARELHPNKKNTLDALCERYRVAIGRRTLHGALLDARLLAEVYVTGLLPRVLRPRHSPTAQTALSIRSVEQEMLAYFARNPHALYGMSPRKFEEFVAAIFKNNGFSVQLTPPSRDGGVDIIAVQHSALTGATVNLIECKRYAPNRPVGIGIVQRLVGVVEQNRAGKGILVTTSTFTRDAIRVAEATPHSLALRDYDAVCEWLSPYVRQ
jgi:DNA polymerase III subunit epsilon